MDSNKQRETLSRLLRREEEATRRPSQSSGQTSHPLKNIDGKTEPSRGDVVRWSVSEED